MIQLLRTVPRNKIKGKIALVRLDFNTEGSWRMEAALPTVRYVCAARGTALILSHKGRPTGAERKTSLQKDAAMLSRLLKKHVTFIPHFKFRAIPTMLRGAKPGSVFVLENLRFLKGEYTNSSALANQLASLGDFYVNDSFAVDHRANASTVALPRRMRSYAGFGLEREILHLSHVVGRAKKPLLVILGGAKTETKLPVIRNFKRVADSFIVGGVLGNTLLKMSGFDIRRTAYDANPPPGVREILRYNNLELPVDFHESGDMLLDIGPESIRRFAKIIASARTIVWNGPFGLMEKKAFQKGTLEIARAILRNKKAFSVVGGGETIALLRRHGLDKKFTFVSTGGGAMLEFLAGKKLPGIEALR